ncbi:hypothetical protein V6Z11_A04G142700 [Gossypium hirsutum]|uniref:MLP-like protein 423 n=1 Tax=Gossypium hirsutum TaxID=3635 RepID=A0ABM3BKA7_GOSHI|nr:MLP-like protein 423 [Gossypium hirsutum]
MKNLLRVVTGILRVRSDNGFLLPEVDDKDWTILYKLVEGEIMKAFKSWKSIFNVMLTGEGSLVKWTTEFEKQNDDVPDPVRYGEFLTTWTKNVDTYLLNN